MATYSRISGEGWRQGDDASSQTKIGADGWWQIEAAVGTQNLTATRFDNTQTFYAATVSPGPVTLSVARFDNAQAFYVPIVAPGAVTLAPGLFTNSNAFYSSTVTLLGGLQTLNPSLFTNTNTFYSATVYDPASSGSSIRYDISTGRLVKIINNFVCISL